MLLTLNIGRLDKNVRVTTDLDLATADCVGTFITRMQCTRAEFIRALVHAYLQEQEQG